MTDTNTHHASHIGRVKADFYLSAHFFVNTAITTFQKIITQMKAETFFDVLWTSNYLYAGTGPVIAREVLRGMSDLSASIDFDIYQDDPDL